MRNLVMLNIITTIAMLCSLFAGYVTHLATHNYGLGMAVVVGLLGLQFSIYAVGYTLNNKE